MKTPPFTLDDAIAASKEWGFNCGPAALCALLDKPPKFLREELPDFYRGYCFMNPSIMFETLQRLTGRHFSGWRQTYRSDPPMRLNRLPEPGAVCEGFMPKLTSGLMRVQWGGPWLGARVPIQARYKFTHWIAVAGDEVFDINAIAAGGWLMRSEWRDEVVPFILEGIKRSDKTFHITHAIEVSR